MFADCCGGGIEFQRWTAALEGHVYLGVGDELFGDRFTHPLLETFVVGNANHPDVSSTGGFGGNHIAIGATADHRPVHFHTSGGIGKIPGLQHLVRQFVNGIAATLGCRARVRGLAGYLERNGSDTGGCQRQII